MMGLYLDMPAHPAESRNAALLTQFVRSPEFGFLVHIGNHNPTATIYWMLNIFRLAQNPEPAQWEAEQESDLETPWVTLWAIQNFDMYSLCDEEGRVLWNEVDVMSSLLCECGEGRADESVAVPTRLYRGERRNSGPLPCHAPHRTRH